MGEHTLTCRESLVFGREGLRATCDCWCHHELLADLRAQVEALPNPHSSLDPGERNGFNDCRAAVLALLSQRNT